MESKEETQELAKSIKITLSGNDFEIKFPTIGAIIDIESNKIAYSNGRYSQLLRSGLVGTNIAVDLVEMAATFVVLIPEFSKIFKLDSIFDLNPIEAKEFVEQYKNVFLPWYSQWLLLLKIEPKVPESEKA